MKIKRYWFQRYKKRKSNPELCNTNRFFWGEEIMKAFTVWQDGMITHFTEETAESSFAEQYKFSVKPVYRHTLLLR